MKKYFSILIILLYTTAGHTQQPTADAIDRLVENARKGFDVPGIAIAVIKDGKVVHLKGYGLRSLATGLPVDEHTAFGIASNSKAFTASAVGILVDEGELHWDDKVISYLSDFRMYDPYVTTNLTIRDMLAHHSGLDQNEGDLMHFPDSADFTTKDVIYNLRFLKPVFGFRTRFGYSNNLYAVAGEVIARVSGMSFDEFIEKKIMLPLGMSESAASYERLRDKSNVVDAHIWWNGKTRLIPRHTLKAAHPAGGLYASITDMSRWVLMQLDDGKFGDPAALRLFSSGVHREMWSPQTILPVGSPGPYNTRMAAYGMGFEIYDITGDNLQIRHTGGINGMTSIVTMIPGLHLGIIVLTNAEESHAMFAITNTIKDAYLGISATDHLQENLDQVLRIRSRDQALRDSLDRVLTGSSAKVTNPTAPTTLLSYSGTYRDNWLGRVTLRVRDGRIWFQSARSPKLNGELFFREADTFIVRWQDRMINADAYLLFRKNKEGKITGFSMKAVLPDTAPGYDFQDLVFTRNP
jgi:CubicO group peptidase (beta-lactamase class C family)